MTELGNPETIYSLIFALGAFLSIFPPHEVKSAGLTIENLFKTYLGDQHLSFVLYHMRRVALTKCIHAALPTVYLFGLVILKYPASPTSVSALDYVFSVITLNKSSYLEILLVTLSLALFVSVVTSTLVSIFNDWGLDALTINLAAHSTRGSWREVAASVDADVRRVDKFTSCIGNSTLYVTETWMIQVNMYNVDLMHQNDVQLELCKAEEFALSPESSAGTQFLEIQVKSERNVDHSFRIRLNSLDFRELKAQLRAPVENARHIVVQQSLSEKFIQAFAQTVADNPKYHLVLTDDDVEQCVGCMQNVANVKLDKRCADEADLTSQCTRCFCRPMWCCSCMARWFASRQEAASPEIWLQGTSPCPTCRAKFCLLDVTLLRDD